MVKNDKKEPAKKSTAPAESDLRFFKEVSELLREGRGKTCQAVNAVMVETYWKVGRRIVEQEQHGKERAGYGEYLLTKLSRHLSNTLGKGFSYANLYNFRLFYLTFPDEQILYTLCRGLGWSQIRLIMRLGDILLTKDGANTGNAALNTVQNEFSLLSSVAFLRFDPNLQNASFFLQQILANEGQRQIKDAVSGNAITRLTLEKINNLKFSYAPLAEQSAIATILSDMDAEIDALTAKLDKVRDIKQGMMQELLTGRIRLVECGSVLPHSKRRRAAALQTEARYE